MIIRSFQTIFLFFFISSLFEIEKSLQLGRPYRPHPKSNKNEYWLKAAANCKELEATPLDFIKAAFSFANIPGGPFPTTYGGKAILRYYKNYAKSLKVGEDSSIFEETIKHSIKSTFQSCCQRMGRTGIPVKILALIISLFILTSCSKTRIFYNYSDWFILKWFDTYFDLNDPQRSDLKTRIARLLDWHRKSELARIAEHLKQLKSRYQKGLKEKDIDWIRTEHKLFWNRIIDRTKPDLIAFLSTIEEEQVRQMEQELIEKDDWLVKQSKMTVDEAHASTLKWFFELLEKED